MEPGEGERQEEQVVSAAPVTRLVRLRSDRSEEDRMSVAAPDEQLVAHRLLLGLAGRVPDEDLARMRLHLADGELADLGQLLADLIGPGGQPLDEDEAEAAAAVLRTGGQDVALALRAVAPGPVPGAVHRFTGRADEPPGSQPGPDDTDAAALQPDVMDALDRAAVAAAVRSPGMLTVWRAFRWSGPGSPERVYLCEGNPGADLVETAAEVQYALSEMDENPQRVEVFAAGERLAPYHEQALAVAAVIWAADVAPVRLARVFDGADRRGPWFAAEHPHLAGADRGRVLAYLRAGRPVLDSLGVMDDVVRPDRGAVVPAGFRSDGVWAWNEAVGYYAEEYDLAPEPELLAHVLAGPAPARPLTRYEQRQVTAALFAPAGTEPVWLVG